MSTRSDVEIWTRPLRAAHPELALVGRNLVLTPVRNFIHGIFIDRTSYKDSSHAICYVTPLIDFGSSGVHFTLSHWLPIPLSNATHFKDTLAELCDLAITKHLAPVRSIPDLLSALDSNAWFFDSSDITRHPLQHAVLLAANGSLAVAEEMLAPAIIKERQLCEIYLANGRAEIAKRSNSRSGSDWIAHAQLRLAYVAELEPLLDLIRAGDRTGIGTLLRERERQSVKAWGVEHLWAPEPYPVERT